MTARDVTTIAVITLVIGLGVIWGLGRKTLDAVDVVFLALFCALVLACGMFAYLTSVHP